MPPVARTRPIPPPTPELLTESFCERCGTRYTFESAAPKARKGGLKRARVLTRGLKNWVVEDGRSIEAAMADARRDEERGLASAQLEAFHQTFNFCMDCRQYTCLDCWNPAEGRCQSCAPLPGQLEAEAGRAQAAMFATGAVATNGAEAPTAWPTHDLEVEAAQAPPSAEPEAVVMPYVPTDLRPVELPDEEPEPIAAIAAAADVAEVVELEPGAVEVEAVAVEALEPEAVEVEAVADVVEVEAVAEVEPEAVAVEELEPEAVAIEPVAAAEPTPTRPAPGWTIIAPEAPTPEAPGEVPGPTPAWPPTGPIYQPPAAAPAPRPTTPSATPAWPAVPPAALAAPAARSVWEESSLGVIARPGSGVQACVSCGLPLSATARFCRRCGTRQG